MLKRIAEEEWAGLCACAGPMLASIWIMSLHVSRAKEEMWVMLVPKLKPDRLRSVQIFEFVRDSIIRNEFKPGEAISKERICQMFGVSRTPASDALHRLSEQELVEIIPQHGTFVSRIDLQSFRESAFLRQCIEVGIAEEITGKLTEDQIETLEINLQAQKEMVANSDVSSFLKLDLKFHRLLSQFSGLQRFDQTLVPLWAQLERLQNLMAPQSGRMEQASKEHEAILVAISGNDPAKSAAAIKHHLGNSMRAMEQVIEDNPDLFD